MVALGLRSIDRLVSSSFTGGASVALPDLLSGEFELSEDIGRYGDIEERDFGGGGRLWGSRIVGLVPGDGGLRTFLHSFRVADIVMFRSLSSFCVVFFGEPRAFRPSLIWLSECSGSCRWMFRLVGVGSVVDAVGLSASGLSPVTRIHTGNPQKVVGCRPNDGTIHKHKRNPAKQSPTE